MSCFVVTKDTMSRVADLIEIAYPDKRYDKNALVAIFDRMNRQAYAQRYKEDDIELDPESSYIPPQEPNTLADILLAADCWLYECDNGTVPQEMMYAYVEKAISKTYKDRASDITGKPVYKFSTAEARQIVKDHDQPTRRWH